MERGSLTTATNPTLPAKRDLIKLDAESTDIESILMLESELDMKITSFKDEADGREYTLSAGLSSDMTTWAATITSVGSSENLYTLEVGIEKLLDAKRSPLEHFVNPEALCQHAINDFKRLKVEISHAAAAAKP